MNIVLLEPKNRENLATVIRSGQNFSVQTVFVVGGFVKQQYKGNIHKFSHQMNTQDGVSNITLIYFDTLSQFLQHLPAQTTLVVVETVSHAIELNNFKHPKNASYLFGRETCGISKSDIAEIESYFEKLNKDIPKQYLEEHGKTAHLKYVRINTPQSLNLGVCASIVIYDRYSKMKTR